jgi:CheY-like chemotaxis protein
MKKIIMADTLKPLVGGSDGMLSRGGFTTRWAGKSEEIVYLHKKEKTDLIVADLEMPGMPVDKLCKIIRADENLRVVSIIMICPDSYRAAEKARSCGSNAVMVKPVNPVRLFHQMSDLLNISARADMREIVRVDVTLDHGPDHFFGVSLNISASGMLIETGRILAIGDRVTCSFVLNYPASTEAEVVRIEEKSAGLHLYGVRFIDAGARSKALIEEFINGRSVQRETIS